MKFDAWAEKQRLVFIDNCTINDYLINQNMGRGHAKTFYFDIFDRFLYKILSVGEVRGILLAEFWQRARGRDAVGAAFAG